MLKGGSTISTSRELEIIEAALDMQRFSMGNTLITFRDKYYEYGVEEDPKERALTIGGYDSAWLADLVAGYLMEKAEENNHFDNTHFVGMYRDDGNLAFKGSLTRLRNSKVGSPVSKPK